MGILGKYTRRSLAVNKLRTIVTIIGIILSVSLFTAVAEGLVSAIHYAVKYEEGTAGAFEIYGQNLSSTDVETIAADDNLKDFSLVRFLGFADIGSSNDYKPYLLVGSFSKDGNADKMAAVIPTSGRLPENSSEIIIPNHLAANGGVNLQIGDKIDLSLGKRIWNGETLLYNTGFIEGEESFEKTTERSYEVVGFYERLDFKIENYECPGYVAFTVSDDKLEDSYANDTGNDTCYGMLIDIKNEGKANEFEEKYMDISEKASFVVHNALLAYKGYSGDDGLRRVLYGFTTILFILIFFGSVSLIYNSFSISVSERTKQFGILKSIGATRKQIIYSVIYEACVLSVIAIPLGLIVGCVGIGVTLYMLRDSFSMMLFDNPGSNIVMSLYIEPAFLAFVAFLGFFTTLVSALIPAFRAVKTEPIEALRQTEDVKINGKVKTSKLTYKLFGFEGMLAAKNFKRNRKKYRVTVFSLFVSIVLFVSASSFSSYLIKSSDVMNPDVMYDIMIEIYDDGSVDPDDVLSRFEAVKGVKSVGYHYESSKLMEIPDEYLSADTISEQADSEEANQFCVSLCFIDDEKFNAIAKENNAVIPDDGEAHGLIQDDYTRITSNSSGNTWSAATVFSEDFHGMKLKYPVYDCDESGEEFIAGYQDIDVVGTTRNSENVVKLCPAVIYPVSMKDKVMNHGIETSIVNNGDITYYIYVNEGEYNVRADLENVINTNYPNCSAGYIDETANQKTQMAIIKVINVFAYGFIVLITLIAIANVFNTISTNVLIRRREFAMLRSIGMSEKGLNKMGNYECFMYGFKGLMYGIPAAILVTWALYEIISDGIEFSFYVPVSSLIIVVVSVFLVVFITMLYSVGKIKKDNTVDALKNENI